MRLRPVGAGDEVVVLWDELADELAAGAARTAAPCRSVARVVVVKCILTNKSYVGVVGDGIR